MWRTVPFEDWYLSASALSLDFFSAHRASNFLSYAMGGSKEPHQIGFPLKKRRTCHLWLMKIKKRLALALPCLFPARLWPKENIKHWEKQEELQKKDRYMLFFSFSYPVCDRWECFDTNDRWWIGTEHMLFMLAAYVGQIIFHCSNSPHKKRAVKGWRTKQIGAAREFRTLSRAQMRSKWIAAWLKQNMPHVLWELKVGVFPPCS
jgi:hypothetical protein